MKTPALLSFLTQKAKHGRSWLYFNRSRKKSIPTGSSGSYKKAREERVCKCAQNNRFGVRAGGKLLSFGTRIVGVPAIIYDQKLASVPSVWLQIAESGAIDGQSGEENPWVYEEIMSGIRRLHHATSRNSHRKGEGEGWGGGKSWEGEVGHLKKWKVIE